MNFAIHKYDEGLISRMCKEHLRGYRENIVFTQEKQRKLIGIHKRGNQNAHTYMKNIHPH